MSVEVIVACVGKKTDSFYDEMNLKTDAVFCIQDDNYNYYETETNNKRQRYYYTADKGVGKNRNLGIMMAQGSIIMFADEDMFFDDDYEKIVEEAFITYKDADAIVFDLTYKNQIMKDKKRRITTKKRLHWFNSMKYGAPRLAIKLSSLNKSHVFFSQLFGGGARYCCGEDSLFVLDLLRNHLKIYTYPVTIGTVKQESSSWFTGYNEKFYYDKGIWIANAFPHFAHLLAIYFAKKFSGGATGWTYFSALKLIFRGIKDFPKI